MFTVGITQRTVSAEKYHELRDALSHDWEVYLNSLFPDDIFIPIPNAISDIERWVRAVSPNALILSNGENWTENQLRDKTETRLLSWAVQNKIPVLGVCRGLQVINKFYGGSICDDIKGYCEKNHVGRHEVHIVSDVFIHELEATVFHLNSYHNQGVLKSGLSNRLKSFAISDDCIEGLYDPSHAVMAIQWHPEREHGGGEKFDFLFRKFLMREFGWA